METFFALLAICAGNSPVTGEFPSQRPMTRSFDVFFDLHGWVNNREAGDLRLQRAHYDVTVMTNTEWSTKRNGWYFADGIFPMYLERNLLYLIIEISLAFAIWQKRRCV